MGGKLAAEVPALHYSLEALALARSLDIHELTNLEVSWPQKVADRQKVLWSDGELGQMCLWWQAMFQEVPSLWLLDFLQVLLTTADLNGIHTVLLLLPHLNHLAPIYLKHSARHMASPSIPKLRAANLIPKETYTL